MTLTELQFWIQTGAFGIGFGVMVWLYRDLAKQMQAREDAHTKAVEAIVARLEARDDRALQVVSANTTALVGLQAAVAQLGNLQRLAERLDELEGGHLRARGANG